MGLNEYAPRATYLSVSDGAVVRRYKSADEDPKAQARTTKSGRVVYERHYRSVDGYVTGIQIGSSTFEGKTIEKAQWKITISDQGKSFILTMPYSSAYAKRFFNALANLDDFGQPLRILPWRMENPERAGKYWLGITVYTRPFDAKPKVPLRFTKDDIPPMREVRLKGQTQWDDEEQMAFWENVVETIIAPKIAEAAGVAGFDAISHANGANDDDDEEIGDAYVPASDNNDRDLDALPF